MKRPQNGFSAIEALLVVIIVGMLGGVGWYVWHSQQQVDKTYSQTANTTVVPKSTAAKTFPAASQPNYLKIKEWGVKVKVSGDSLPYYVFVGKGQKDRNENTSDVDAVYIYSTKYDNTKNADGQMCKDVDDNQMDPKFYSKPPSKRQFIVAVRFQEGAISSDATQYAIMPAVKIGNYEYVVSTASHYAPGCATLWRGSVTASQSDQKILDAEQSILKTLTTDFKTLSQ
jgi:Tfp pilus assembly protein PilE